MLRPVEPLWPALAAATRRRVPRLAFQLNGTQVGSVAVAHAPVLHELAQACGVDVRGGEPGVPGLLLRAASAAQATAALQRLNEALRACGLIQGWRDEVFAVPDPTTLQTLAHMERAAARFWGTLTFGAHATGFVRGSDGRPSHLWIAQRSHTKATDPGLYDNLIGGGVPAGQTALQAVLREGFEEAGLTPEQLGGLRTARAAAMAPCAVPAGPPAGSVLCVHRDVPHGLQHEWLVCFDVELPPGVVPRNQDGEVAGFTCLPLAQAAAVAASARMTVDASLVTLDFLLRHQLLAAAGSPTPGFGLPASAQQVDGLTQALKDLRVVPPTGPVEAWV